MSALNPRARLTLLVASLTSWGALCGGLGCAGGVGPSQAHRSHELTTLAPTLNDHLFRCAPSERLAPTLKGAPPLEGDALEGDVLERGEQARERLERLSLRDPHAALLSAPLLKAWRPLVRSILSAHPHLPQAIDALTWVEGVATRPELWPSLWLSVDLLGGLGAPLQALIEPLLRADVSSERALLWLKAAPSWAPLSHLSADPLEALSAWRAARWSPLERGSVGVILEEQRLLYVSESGEGVRLVQEVLRVNNKRGVEELGEVALPPRATLLSLYSLKPDGARRAPVIIAEKESYSLQDLQVGDVLIARYLEPLSALRRAGGALTPLLPLRDPQRAVWRRAYHVWRSGSERALTVDVHNAQLSTSAPNADRSLTSALSGAREVSLSRSTWRGGALVSVEVREALPAPREPASLSDGLPSVEVGDPSEAEREWGEVVSALRERLTLSAGELQELRRWALSPQRLGVRLWEAVRDEQPLLESQPPLEALREGRGARALVLWAALSALGERCWLSVAGPPKRRSTWRWPPTSAPTSAPLNPTEGYDHLLVRCEERAHTPDTHTPDTHTPDTHTPGKHTQGLVFDPALYLSPRGVRATYLDGGVALDVWPPPPEASCEALTGETPRAWPLRAHPLTSAAHTGRPQERHDVSVSLWLDPEGARGLLGARVLYAAVEHSLEGEEGALLFERLERASLEEQRAWLEGQWGAWLGASEASEVRFVWSEQGGLALSYRLKVTARLPLKLSLSPQSWGARFASLEARHTPLLLPSISQSLTLTLNEPLEGAPQEPSSPLLTLTGEETSLSWAAQENATTSPEASFSLKVSAHKLTEQWRLLGGALDPQGYPSWARFARDVSRREGSVTLRLQEPALRATPSAQGAARK